MFPKIRLVNGRAMIVGSPAVWLRAAPVTGVQRCVGTLKICSGTCPPWATKAPRFFGYGSLGWF